MTAPQGGRQHAKRRHKDPLRLLLPYWPLPQPPRIAHSRDAPLEVDNVPAARAGAAGDPSRHNVRPVIAFRTPPRSLQQAAPSDEGLRAEIPDTGIPRTMVSGGFASLSLREWCHDADLQVNARTPLPYAAAVEDLEGIKLLLARDTEAVQALREVAPN